MAIQLKDSGFHHKAAIFPKILGFVREKPTLNFLHKTERLDFSAREVGGVGEWGREKGMSGAQHVTCTGKCVKNLFTDLYR